MLPTKENPKVFAVAAIFALACKEEVSLVILMLSACAAVVRKQKWAWWGVAGSLCWIAVVLKLMPFFAGVEHSAYLALYSRWGKTPLGIVWGILTRPLEALRELVLCQGHSTAPGVYPLLLLFPFAFFPLLAPEILLFGLPNYALIALNERVTFRELGYQYASTILPWLAVASVVGWKRLLQVGDELPKPLHLR